MAKQPATGTNPSQITYVPQQTLEKRVRRALRKQGLQLFKPRPSLAIRPGECAVTDGPYRILRSGLTLESLARELGVLADHERLDTPAPPAPADWVWRVCRTVTETVGGVAVTRYEPLPGVYPSQYAAIEAAHSLGLPDLAVVGGAPEECPR